MTNWDCARDAIILVGTVAIILCIAVGLVIYLEPEEQAKPKQGVTVDIRVRGPGSIDIQAPGFNMKGRESRWDF